MNKTRGWKDDAAKHDKSRKGLKVESAHQEKEARVCEARELAVRAAKGDLAKASRPRQQSKKEHQRLASPR